MKRFRLQDCIYLFLVLPLSAVLLHGCAEMNTAGTAVDRRTVGTIVEDEGIELRSTNRVSERFGDKVHVNITSYNRSVLVTGEVPNTPTKMDIEKLIQAVPNVRGITNELQVVDATSVTSRATDSTITGKVKARLFDSGKLNALHVKVVTEAGVVYLLGIVTDGEANAAAEVARTTGGVRKVVKVFDYCKPTEEICARGGRPEEPKKAGS